MLKSLAARGRDYLLRPLLNRPAGIQLPDAAVQLQLMLTYRSLKRSGASLPTLRDVGFKVYSQTDEDGILLYIFSLLGDGPKTAVEICAGDGIECNTANLILNHGWHVLLVDGDEKQIQRGVDYYRAHPGTYVYPPVFKKAWVTRDNVNDLVKSSGFSGEIDLLSLDMDGVDYWIWKALDQVDPRVVVVEYQDIIGPELALTVPYSDSFDARRYPMTDGMPNYCGASLPAFIKLARSRGYRLVGCNRLGYNAFFVKEGLAESELPEIGAQEYLKHPKNVWGMQTRFPLVRDMPWAQV